MRNGVFLAVSVSKDVTVIRDSSSAGHSERITVPMIRLQPLPKVSTEGLEKLRVLTLDS